MHMYEVSLALAVSCSGILALYTLALGLRRYLALRHIPGPLLARLSNFWLFYKFRIWVTFPEISLDLDRRYGPVALYGPRRVVVSDLNALSQIYGISKNVWIKAENYEIPVPVINGRLQPSFLSIRDDSLATSIKRQINVGFNPTAISRYEHHIDGTVESLIVKLTDLPTQPFDLQKWLSFFAFDTICRIAFSDSPDLLGHGSDLGATIEGANTRFLFWHSWFALPWLEALIYKNRFIKANPSASVLTAMAVQRVSKRTEAGGAGTEKDLLNLYFEAQDRTPDVFTKQLVTGLTLTTIHAGSETTAGTLGIALAALLLHPQAYEEAKQEIRTTGLSAPPQLSEVRKLAYLEACIKESQRVYPFSLDPLERIVPAEGATVAAVWIPGGTTIAINAAALSQQAQIYDPKNIYPVTSFEPKRWVDCDSSQRADMERASMAFGHGKRSCLGIHLAQAELLKMSAALMLNFDIELADPSYDMNAMMGRGALATLKELRVKLTARKQ